MYTEEQRKQHIFALQSALRRLQQQTGGTPPIVADGIYGPETTRAVRAFQREYGLPSTGTADATTWNAIFAQYRAACTGDCLPTAVQFFPAGASAALAVGDRSCTVLVLQCMLSALATHFPTMPRAPHSGTYDSDTAQAVYYLQGVSGLAQTGLTDRPTWDAITGLHNAYFGRTPLAWLESAQE